MYDLYSTNFCHAAGISRFSTQNKHVKKEQKRICATQ